MENRKRKLNKTARSNQSNILPMDGVVNYYGKILNTTQSVKFFEELLATISWKNDEALIYGKKIITKRKVAWYADKPFSYTYSKVTKKALSWAPVLRELKKLVEEVTGENYNSCLLNLYHNGSEGMTWHSDGEKDLVLHGSIASLSFGAERKFSFKHKKTKEVVSLVLESSSLLVMKGITQECWQHRLPPTKKVSTPRINLTFRQINSE